MEGARDGWVNAQLATDLDILRGIFGQVTLPDEDGPVPYEEVILEAEDWVDNYVS